MIGRGAAAAAHNLRSGRNRLARKAGHVLRRAEIDIAPFHRARHAGIGHGRDGQRGRGAHGFDGGQHGRWTSGAVHAHGVRAPLGKQRGGLLRRRSIQAVAFIVHRDHHHDRQIGRGFLRRQQRFARLVQRRHGLDDEHVHARIDQRANLLGKCGARLIEPGFAQRLQPHAQRPDGARHPGLASLLFFQVGNGLLGEPHAGGVDLGHFAGQSVARQPEAVGAERVGLQNLGAGLQVVFVDGQDQPGIGEIQLVVAAVDEDAAGIQNRAHGAVGEHGRAGEDVGKVSHSLAMLSHRREFALHPGAGDVVTSSRGRNLGSRRARLLRHAAKEPEGGLLCYTSRVKSYAGIGPG